MKIYLDAWRINRLTDDQSQARILREAEAIEELVGLATSEPNVCIGNVVLEAEISRNSDPERRADAESPSRVYQTDRKARRRNRRPRAQIA